MGAYLQVMRVFISYALQDKDWASRLVSDLKQAGLEVWDPESQVYPGDNYALQVGKALERANAIVFLVSPDAVKSQSFTREMQYAIGEERFRDRVIPVIVRRTQEMPWILKRLSPEKGDPGRVSQRIVERLRGARAA
jgi:hypothetical protein